MVADHSGDFSAHGQHERRTTAAGLDRHIPQRAVLMRALLALLRRFSHAKGGLAAIEFALILPFMALLYFGSIEVSLLISADRKVSQTASSLADLVARVDTINPSGVSDVF